MEFVAQRDAIAPVLIRNESVAAASSVFPASDTWQIHCDELTGEAFISHIRQKAQGCAISYGVRVDEFSPPMVLDLKKVSSGVCNPDVDQACGPRSARA
jgi:hypothetical protein